MRRNSLKLDKLLGRTMPYNYFDDDSEIFAYSIETELGGNSNILTKAILDCTKRRFEDEE